MVRSRQNKFSKPIVMKKNIETEKRFKLKYLLGGGVFICMVFVICLSYSLGDRSTPPEYISYQKENWRANVLTADQLLYLNNQISMSRLKEILNEILIPRVPGSKNITKVTSNIVSRLQDLGWKLTHDSFVDKPPHPHPRTSFRSIIATHNPVASRRLILACHHDSKITPDGFLGAIDSAVPCSIMLELAYALNQSLNALRQQQTTNKHFTHDITLQLVFLDGEEAFVAWSDQDSLYGSRHLASKWQRNNKLDSIDLFVLLDLIGTADTTFHDYTATKTRWFTYTSNLENRMTLNGILRPHSPVFTSNYIYNQYRVEDDHIPFMKRGVPIFHMITLPFPNVWHTIRDNYDALNFDRIELVTKITLSFVAEYLHLN